MILGKKRLECAGVASRLHAFQEEIEENHSALKNLNQPTSSKSNDTKNDPFSDFGSLLQGPYVISYQNEKAYKHSDNFVFIGFEEVDFDNPSQDLPPIPEADILELVKEPIKELHDLTPEPLYTLLDSNTLLILRYRIEYHEMIPLVGIGVQLSKTKNNTLIISKVLPQSPAAKIGLQQGTEITHIQNTATKHLTLSSALNLLEGDSGQAIELTIKADSGHKKNINNSNKTRIHHNP